MATLRGSTEEEQVHMVSLGGHGVSSIKNPSVRVQLAAVRQNVWAIKDIKNPSNELKLIVVERDVCTLEYIEEQPPYLQLLAVQKDGCVIKNIKNPSEQIQLVAVRQDARAIGCIENPSEQIQLVAVKVNGLALGSIKNPSVAVQLEAVINNYLAIQYIANPSVQLQAIAIKQDIRALPFIENPAKEVYLILGGANPKIKGLDQKDSRPRPKIGERKVSLGIINKGGAVSKEKAMIELIRETIKRTKFEGLVHVAGGMVRDEMLGRSSKDIDLVIDMENGGIEFAKWFTKLYSVYKEDSNPVIFLRFGVARFTLPKITWHDIDLSEVEIECVMPRSEVNYEDDNRKSIVIRKASLEVDAMRRDFNINTLYKDVSTDEILDFTGAGLRDLKARVIDTPVEPDLTFGDPKYGDALRMLRAIRFAAQLGFTPTERVLKSIETNRSKLQNISKERIQAELVKILMGDYVIAGVKLLKDTKLLYEFLPEMESMVGLEQGIYHTKDGFGHTIDVLAELESERRLELRLAALFHDIGKPEVREPHERKGYQFLKHEIASAKMTEKIMKRLKFPNELTEKVVLLVRHHMGLRAARGKKKLSDKALRKFARKMGDDETLYMALELVKADMVVHPGQEDGGDVIELIRCRYDTLDSIADLYIRQPIINGNDLKELFGLKEGPQIGDFLKFAQDIFDTNPEIGFHAMADHLTELKQDLDLYGSCFVIDGVRIDPIDVVITNGKPERISRD